MKRKGNFCANKTNDKNVIENQIPTSLQNLFNSTQHQKTCYTRKTYSQINDLFYYMKMKFLSDRQIDKGDTKGFHLFSVTYQQDNYSTYVIRKGHYFKKAKIYNSRIHLMTPPG